MLKFVSSLLFSSLLFSSLLLILGCSNPALLIDIKNNNAVGLLKTENIPKRSEVIKNEENVVSDRTAVLTGADLYLNSKFVRSIIPASRFPKITRGARRY